MRWERIFGPSCEQPEAGGGRLEVAAMASFPDKQRNGRAVVESGRVNRTETGFGTSGVHVNQRLHARENTGVQRWGLRPGEGGEDPS